MAIAAEAASLSSACLEIALVIVDEHDRRHLLGALDGKNIVAQWEGTEPDVLVAQTNAAGGPDAFVVAADAARQGEWIGALRSAFPETPIVVVVGPDSVSPRALRATLGGGADGIVTRQSLQESLAPAIRAVCAGQLSIPRSFRSTFSKPLLSTREKQILAMVVMGFRNSEIGARLFLAETTVKSHLSSAFAKLGVRSRTEATALILDPDSGLGTGILAISEGEASPRPANG